ncbi:MAG: cell division protein FtsQ/DivIB [Terracidiphilus sp.]
MRQIASPAGRTLPALPLDSHVPDDDDSPLLKPERQGGGRFERPHKPWWRPASTVGRVLLLLVMLAVLSGLTASAYLLKNYLDRDARFRIAGAGNIDATGLTEVSRAEMLPVFGEDIGRNIFYVPLSERRRQLEQLPWVERATVMRLLPDQIRVSVVERQPVAFVRLGPQIGLVDASGVLLTMPAALMAQRHYSFPVVTGFDAHDPLASRKARMAVYQRLLAELDSNGQKLSEQISEIDLTDPADAKVLMPEQGGDILAHFGEDQFLERYQRYKANIGEWRQQYPKLAAVDLRYEQQVVLEMTAGTNVAQAAAEEQSAAAVGDGKPANVQTAGESAETQPSVVKALIGQSRTNTPVKPGKTDAKPVGTRSTKPINSTARKNPKTVKASAVKAAKTKKRAQAKAAALNVSRQKSAPTNLPAASAGIEQ